MFPKPDEFFKQSFEQWEKQTADFWNNMLRDPSFLKSSWQAMELALQSQQAMNKAVQQNLETWGVPTRETFDQIQHQINRLQIMLDDLDERLNELVDEINEL